MMTTSLHDLHPRLRAQCSGWLLISALAGVAWPHSARGQAVGASPSLSLADVLSAVFARHPLVEASHARVRAAEGVRTTAGLLGNPIVSYVVDYTSAAAGSASTLEREATTVATLPLEVLYQRRARMRGADARVRGAEADLGAARQRVALDAVSAFYRVALAQERVAVLTDLAAWLDTLVGYNRVRVKEGAAAEADLLRAGIEYDRVLADGAADQADLARGRAALSAFLGESGGTRTPAVGGANRPLMLLPTDSVDSSAMIDKAMRQRPDLSAARERVAAARADVTAEHAKTLRQLGAMIGSKQMGGTNSLVAGVSVSLPLFDLNRGEAARASAEHDAAAFELIAQERMVRADVNGAYEAARLLTARAAALTPGDSTDFLTRADEARRIALGAYREGGASLLQVLDAARAWSDARIAYFRVLYAQQESVLALMAARGIDLSLAIPALSAPSPR